MSYGGIIVNGEVTINIYGDEETKAHKIDVHKLRTSSAVISAKKRVKGRDNICQCCGEIGVNGHLEVHHIFPVSKYPSLASDENNMVSLCQKCHKKLHDEYEETNGVTYGEFMKRFAKRF